ncbi:MAG: PadR family transcriptional regulator [Oscillospiraceae bacterium]
MSLENGILGYLSLKPLSGYDIKKIFNMSAAYFWPADQAQIYRTLTSLEDDGLVEVSGFEQDAGPSKKLYKITEKGRERLHDWLLSQKQSDYVIRRPFLMQMFFSGELSPDEQLALIDAQYEQTQILINRLNENYSRNKNNMAQTVGLAEDDPRFKAAERVNQWGVLSCETYLTFLRRIREEISADIWG